MSPASSSAPKRPRAVILGCAGRVLSADERRFFGDADPLGFILFQRNCDNPGQVKALIGELLHDDAARRQVGANGRQTILQQHTCAHRAQQLVEICEDLNR